MANQGEDNAAQKAEGGRKNITFFRSFTEMENVQLAYFASLSPVELLQNHKRLSMAAFGLTAEPKPDGRSRVIKFGKPE